MADEKKEPWLNLLALTTVILAVCATLATFRSAADLCEEFRAPAADRFVLHCASRGIVKPEEFFYDGEKGCRFEPEALKRFIAAYERWMTRPAAAGASWSRPVSRIGPTFLPAAAPAARASG